MIDVNLYYCEALENTYLKYGSSYLSLGRFQLEHGLQL
jgi:hypothetical protein